MIHRYVIGGVAFNSDRVLPDLSRDGFSDLDVTVQYADDVPTALPLSGPGGTSGSFDPASCQLTIQDLDDGVQNAWLLRQLSPTVSSVTERLVLHASAIATPSTVVAFVGESGAGKTTLARFLDQAPTACVADDLVPVRFLARPSSPIAGTLHPLAAVCFLERNGGVLELSRVPQATALELQIHHGFGEHGTQDAWTFQFDAYHRLVTSVPHYRLVIPDDVGALERVADLVRSSFGRKPTS